MARSIECVRLKSCFFVAFVLKSTANVARACKGTSPQSRRSCHPIHGRLQAGRSSCEGGWAFFGTAHSYQHEAPGVMHSLQQLFQRRKIIYSCDSWVTRTSVPQNNAKLCAHVITGHRLKSSPGPAACCGSSAGVLIAETKRPRPGVPGDAGTPLLPSSLP